MLLVAFILIQQHAMFGLSDKGAATRLAFLLTGVWWLGFALPSFALLKNVPTCATTQHVLRTPGDYLKTFKELRGYRDLCRFLFAFLLYNDGIQTIIAVSAIFAREELGLGTGTSINSCTSPG